MLTITGSLTKTKVEHTESALPASIPVPSRREAIEALGHVQNMVSNQLSSMLVDGEKVVIEHEFEILRRFVLTR